MRIDWLRIPTYRNLRNFEINFDESQPTTVLLGHNGAGKSNLLEAIVEIFSNLDSDQPAPFTYSMRYFCHGQAIEVHADPQSMRRPSVSVDGKLLSQAEFNKRKNENPRPLLPAYIFGYYSGWISRLEQRFNEKTRRYYYQVLRNPNFDNVPRRFFFCRKEYSQLVLLAFFLSNDPHAKQLLNDYLNIEFFEMALFVLKRPWWGKNSKSRSKSSEEASDPRFWNAGGAFRDFLGRLWENALAPIRNTEAVERDIRHSSEQTERLYLYIKNETVLKALRHPYESIKLLFNNLESLYLCDLVDDVRVRVRKKDGSRVTFAQLSEGEQQLLTVLGLLLFTQEDESLYLLDEPNTHLNPVWTYDYLRLLQQNIIAEKGQLIVATHDPLMIGSLYKNQVRVMKQEEEATIAAEPEYDPVGIGVEGLLVSELYGLPSTLAPEILEKLNRHYKLLGNPNKTDEEQMELIQLAQELNNLGVSRTHPNPYFMQFAAALARRSPKVQQGLTKEEIDAQAQLADEVLAEILAEEEQER